MRLLSSWGIPALALILICAPLIWIAVSSLRNSSPDPIDTAALDYARTQIVWTDGPTIVSTHIVTMRQLPAALAAYLPLRVRQDVNVAELRRKYEPGFRVGVVALHGSFNSLPPDEGVTLHDLVVLVDAAKKKAIFLTD